MATLTAAPATYVALRLQGALPSRRIRGRSAWKNPSEPLLCSLATGYKTGYNHKIWSTRHKRLAALHFDDRTKGVEQSPVMRLQQIFALVSTACEI